MHDEVSNDGIRSFSIHKDRDGISHRKIGHPLCVSVFRVTPMLHVGSERFISHRNCLRRFSDCVLVRQTKRTDLY